MCVREGATKHKPRSNHKTVVAKMSSDQKITDQLHLKEQIGSGTLVHKTDEVCSVKLIFHRTDN